MIQAIRLLDLQQSGPQQSNTSLGGPLLNILTPKIRKLELKHT